MNEHQRRMILQAMDDLDEKDESDIWTEELRALYNEAIKKSKKLHPSNDKNP